MSLYKILDAATGHTANVEKPDMCLVGETEASEVNLHRHGKNLQNPDRKG